MKSVMTASPRSDPRPAWLTQEAWPFPVRRVQHDGATISYTDVGNGPTLLFVHTGMWSILWRDVIERLQDSFRCVALDAPGCGLSEHRTPNVDLVVAAGAVAAVVNELDLVDVTLVVHDFGAPAALEAAARWPRRVAGLVVINGFGWRPSGIVFRQMLALMGNPLMRELDAFTGWLPRLSATRFGVGRHWTRATRKTYRRGLRRRQRRSFHRYVNAARRHDYTLIDTAIGALADRPLLTIFGQRNDPLKFQPKWKQRFPHATQVTVAKGYHFPMCDDPDLVAGTLTSWHANHLLMQHSD